MGTKKMEKLQGFMFDACSFLICPQAHCHGNSPEAHTKHPTCIPLPQLHFHGNEMTTEPGDLPQSLLKRPKVMSIVKVWCRTFL